MKLEKAMRFCSILTAGVFLAAEVVGAQEPGMGNPSPQQQQQPPTAGDTMGAPDSNGQPNMSNYAISAFLKSVFENDQAQVQMSQLAQQKAASDDVKQYSEQMVNVHTKLDQQLGPMAKQLGLSQPKGPAKKDKKELEKLQGLSGTEFETEYLQAMADQQQQSLKTFDKQCKDNTNPGVQETAKADAQVLEQNYQILQKLAQAHNVTLQEQAQK